MGPEIKGTLMIVSKVIHERPSAGAGSLSRGGVPISLQRSSQGVLSPSGARAAGAMFGNNPQAFSRDLKKMDGATTEIAKQFNIFAEISKMFNQEFFDIMRVMGVSFKQIAGVRLGARMGAKATGGSGKGAAAVGAAGGGKGAAAAGIGLAGAGALAALAGVGILGGAAGKGTAKVTGLDDTIMTGTGVITALLSIAGPLSLLAPIAAGIGVGIALLKKGVESSEAIKALQESIGNGLGSLIDMAMIGLYMIIDKLGLVQLVVDGLTFVKDKIVLLGEGVLGLKDGLVEKFETFEGQWDDLITKWGKFSADFGTAKDSIVDFFNQPVGEQIKSAAGMLSDALKIAGLDPTKLVDFNLPFDLTELKLSNLLNPGKYINWEKHMDLTDLKLSSLLNPGKYINWEKHMDLADLKLSSMPGVGKLIDWDMALDMSEILVSGQLSPMDIIDAAKQLDMTKFNVAKLNPSEYLKFGSLDFMDLLDPVKSFNLADITDWDDWIKDLAKAVVDGFKDAGGDVKDTVKGWFS